MLVLSRMTDERLVIGSGVDAVVVTVVKIQGDKVCLGVEAPRRMPVDRSEVRGGRTWHRVVGWVVWGVFDVGAGVLRGDGWGRFLGGVLRRAYLCVLVFDRGVCGGVGDGVGGF